MFETHVKSRTTANAAAFGTAALAFFAFVIAVLYFQPLPLPPPAWPHDYAHLMDIPESLRRLPMQLPEKQVGVAQPAAAHSAPLEIHNSDEAPEKLAVLARPTRPSGPAIQVPSAKPFRAEQGTLARLVEGAGGTFPQFSVQEDRNFFLALKSLPVSWIVAGRGSFEVGHTVTRWIPGPLGQLAPEPTRWRITAGYEARCLKDPSLFPELAEIRLMAAAIDAMPEAEEFVCALYTSEQYAGLVGKVIQATAGRPPVAAPLLLWTMEGGEAYLHVKGFKESSVWQAPK